jgi:hypothetical protein
VIAADLAAVTAAGGGGADDSLADEILWKKNLQTCSRTATN